MAELYHECVRNSLRSVEQAFEKHFKFMPPVSMLVGENAAAKVHVVRPEGYPQHPFFVTDVFAEIDGLITDPSEQIFIETLQQLLSFYDQKVIDLLPFVQEPFFLPFIE